jgi:hypothetical protein
MKVVYKGIEYNEGDKIKFFVKNWKYKSTFNNTRIEWEDEYIGEIKFGIYDDNEQYVNIDHLGFYVEYINKSAEYRSNEPSKDTLPDIINYNRGELIK